MLLEHVADQADAREVAHPLADGTRGHLVEGVPDFGLDQCGGRIRVLLGEGHGPLVAEVGIRDRRDVDADGFERDVHALL